MRASHLEVAAWVREHSAPGDYVFTFVGGGIVPGASERQSPSRYFNMHFLYARDAIEEVQRDLEARPPRFVVAGQRGPRWLRAYLDQCCHVVRGTERGLVVYERRAAGAP
jgi:hypothetical protein